MIEGCSFSEGANGIVEEEGHEREAGGSQGPSPGRRAPAVVNGSGPTQNQTLSDCSEGQVMYEQNPISRVLSHPAPSRTYRSLDLAGRGLPSAGGVAGRRWEVLILPCPSSENHAGDSREEGCL